MALLADGLSGNAGGGAEPPFLTADCDLAAIHDFVTRVLSQSNSFRLSLLPMFFTRDIL